MNKRYMNFNKDLVKNVEVRVQSFENSKNKICIS